MEPALILCAISSLTAEPILMLGSISSAVMALVALITLVFQKPRKWLRKWIQNINKEQLDEQLAPINEKLTFLMQQTEKAEAAERTRLGHSIMTIYDRSIVRGYITLADKKDLIDLHQAYKERHGNHHVDEYYEILMAMETQ